MTIVNWINSLSTPIMIIIITTVTLLAILFQALLIRKFVKILTNNDTKEQTLNEGNKLDVGLLQKSDTYLNSKNIKNVQSGDTK